MPDYVGFTIMLVGWTLVRNLPSVLHFYRQLSRPKIANLVTPFHQMFFVNDLRIAYPHAEHERVPVCELLNSERQTFVCPRLTHSCQ